MFPGRSLSQNEEIPFVSLRSQIVHLKLVNYPLFFPRGVLFYSRSKKETTLPLSFLSLFSLFL